MTAVTEKIPLHERVPVEEITRQAKEVRFSRTVLALIGGLLWCAGYIAAKVFKYLWIACAWSAVAVRTGWREARGEPLNQPTLQAVLAENAQLRAALDRLQVGGL